MKFKRLFVAVLTLLSTAMVVAQNMSQLPPIPVDPEVRIGKLENGLTYYIRHNAWPEQRALFRRMITNAVWHISWSIWPLMVRSTSRAMRCCAGVRA